jgi:chaperone modulatory protein CbpM
MNSKKTELLSGDLIGEDEEISLAQLCRACELISVSLRRVRITRNLQRDLGVNPPGAALALELLEEIEELRSRLQHLEK